jgi:transcriptional regulator with XRE-family HTH domain
MSIFAGQQLRRLREGLGLTMRDVESASAAIAAKYSNNEYFIPLSRLSEIETKGLVPSIFRLYSLAAIFQEDYRKLSSWYDINWDALAADYAFVQIRKTHPFGVRPDPEGLQVPAIMDPGFDVRRTMNLGRMIQKWGSVPLAFIDKLSQSAHTYAFVGTEDFTMYPLVLPGSFLQIDEKKTQVATEGWRSEYERPIYFVETRDEFICSWCSMGQSDQLIIQSHPLSPVAPRMFRYPQEAEIVGQVVGIAMRLDEWKRVEPNATHKQPERLN